MARRREFNVFSLSFLDVMSCGFGATLLVFLILNHNTDMEFQKINQNLISETDMLEREVKEGRDNLVELRNTIAELSEEQAKADGRSKQLLAEISKRRDELSTDDKDSLAKVEHLNRLKSDIEQLEKENLRLREQAEDRRGANVRRFEGEGDRQYLTGLKLGGRHILILLDRSASMLDATLVNVLRTRNMDPATQRRSRKWQNALATVEWLSAQLPEQSNFQLYAFNTEATPVLAGTAGKWQPASDRPALNRAIEEMRKLLPQGGTSLYQAFSAAATMNPRPDNIYLITDGLPTQGAGSPRQGTVSGRDRVKYYNQALDRLPRGVPVNVIMAPMEGDPFAASAFWKLAIDTRGAFLAPSADWP